MSARIDPLSLSLALFFPLVPFAPHSPPPGAASPVSFSLSVSLPINQCHLMGKDTNAKREEPKGTPTLMA